MFVCLWPVGMAASDRGAGGDDHTDPHHRGARRVLWQSDGAIVVVGVRIANSASGEWDWGTAA